MEFNLKNINDFKYLTKENIIDSLYEEDIFSFYLNEQVDLKKEYLSPFRADKEPTCKFFKGRNGRLLFIDFGQNSSVSDCFQFVQKMFNISFFDSLLKINKDFNLNLGNNSFNEYYYKSIRDPLNFKSIRVAYKKPANLLVKTREIKMYDNVYWNQYGIGLNTLNHFNVNCVQVVYLDNSIIWRNTETNPIYAYKFSGGKKKVYRPMEENKKFKFLSSPGISNIYQGEDQLPEVGDLLIITKSLKDVMVLYTLGFNAIAPNSESYVIPEGDMKRFKERFKNLFLFYDNDLTGINTAYAISEKYSIPYSYIILNRDCYSKDVKDISDFYKTYGRNSTLGLITKKLEKHGY